MYDCFLECNSKINIDSCLVRVSIQEDFPEKLNTVLDMHASLSEMAGSHDQNVFPVN